MSEYLWVPVQHNSGASAAWELHRKDRGIYSGRERVTLEKLGRRFGHSHYRVIIFHPGRNHNEHTYHAATEEVARAIAIAFWRVG